MAFPVAMAAMMAASAYKAKQDQNKADRDRMVEAEVMRNSPWTNMKPNRVQDPDGTGTMMQGAASGYAMDQNMASQQNQQDLQKAQIDWYKNNPGSPAATNTAGSAGSAAEVGTQPSSVSSPGAVGPDGMPLRRTSGWMQRPPQY